jgi:neutral ceramidase
MSNRIAHSISRLDPAHPSFQHQRKFFFSADHRCYDTKDPSQVTRGVQLMNNRRFELVNWSIAVLILAFWPIQYDAAIASQPERNLRAGAVAIDITPNKFPVGSSGSMTPRQAQMAHDPLHARCLVIDNGETMVAFAICDSCMIPREIFDAAKSRVSSTIGLPADHILCSATHTHTGVSVAPTFQSSVEVEYRELLIQEIAAGIIEAHSQLEPARIGWAVGNNPRQVFNRRWFLRRGVEMQDPFDLGTDKVRMNPSPNSKSLLKPAGPIDPEIPLFCVESLDGRPIAMWANYSLHYVGGVPAQSLSADYFGEFARQFTDLIDAQKVQPKFVAAMSNGTSGDINNINFFEGRAKQPPFEQIKAVAADVAQSAHVAYQRVEYHDWVPIKMIEKEIELGVRQPNESEIDRAKKLIGESGKGPWKDRRLIYANETVDIAKYSPTVKVKLQSIRIGGLGIVTTPCETFVETGLAIKKESPLKPTFTIELANGYNGYLPTRGQHALGGYETWRAKSSYLAVDAEQKISSTLLEMLEEVAK